MKKRNTFSGSIGFVLAAAASAVGLGNIWRFPYLAAKYGGGMFLLIYIILVVTFGYTLMIAENAIGRKTGKSALTAFGELSKKWAFIGVIATLIPCVILPYYNVIGGWIIKYTVGYLTGSHTAMSGDSYFNGMLADPVQMMLFQFLFTLATTLIVLKGVQKGIEKSSVILMPALIVLAIVITIYSITMPGAMEGVKYFFLPNFSDFSIMGVISAMGQMFFSLSLAMGIMIAYGSYLPKDSNLEKSVSRIELFDTIVAILAGLMIIPAVFAFDKDMLNQGPGLMFVTLPKVFEAMGSPTVVGSVFFLLVLFAALTSSVSVMEAIVSSLTDKLKWGRTKTTLIVAIGTLVVGILPILGYSVLSDFHILNFDILDFMDFVTNSVLMPICALLTCIFVVYVIGVNSIAEEIELSGRFKRQKMFNIVIKYIAPIMLIIILVSSVLNSLGIIKL